MIWMIECTNGLWFVHPRQLELLNFIQNIQSNRHFDWVDCMYWRPPPNPSPKCQESWKATVEVNEKLITIWRGEKLNERRKKEGKGQSSDYFGNCYLMTGQGVRRGLGNIIFVCLLNEECEQPCMNIPFSLTFYLSGVLQFRFIKR